MDAAPLFEACRLWKKTSASGHTYLVGRMAGVRVLVMAARERDGEEAHTHVLLFGRADSKPRAAQAAQDPARPPQRAPLSSRPRQLNGSHGRRTQIPDDPLPF